MGKGGDNQSAPRPERPLSRLQSVESETDFQSRAELNSIEPTIDNDNRKDIQAENHTLLREREEKVAKEPKFHWDHRNNPHENRRKDILKAHPEVKKHFGIDPLTKYKVIATIAFQISSIHLLQGAPWYTWAFCCYTICGMTNHMISLSLHEISHNLAFKKVVSNRILAIISNLPMGIPAAASFKRYHMEHHRYQGEFGVDPDLPLDFEGWFFSSRAKKALWVFLQPATYSLRPLITNPKSPGKWEIINISAAVAFDLSILYVFGLGGLLYLLLGTILGLGLHPMSGHFLSEHLVLCEGQETFSYYGPLNWLGYNVGYHNEHHDFAFVSVKNLPMMRVCAPEFYDDIAHYHSFVKVLYDFIFDDKLSPYSRIKRVNVENSEIKELRARGGLIK
uniref:Sphingolipid delta4-desaturase N-terminal domain-containing protein n=1 Tax=Helicotheca tamesis TaxID=374047 RepID=A0A7S2I3B7_9STRA|mmetsp:Transcript_5050/g.6959  ORF Transcript_5050/g.6959 Transcript_5050/m.6959 type:complete len:393 (+) Transcript_5050:84-1262(+)|eukprot:CAMPEP_0185729524 /NCGR_PEP_ID=MMETSP1171-20130828/6304_1 /TAXON_ID=374046 /ORGANISM="Helicotheca tamensis, Strain CCMP826" /LENGTH=392 /DNA_ID=CAMNT_0028398391 /DNA_START=37 /DNA_END=1215 /DNA_ORIENTATION=+